MTRYDRIFITAMLTLIMLRVAVVLPLNDWRGTVLAFLFALAATVYVLRNKVQP